MKCRNKSIFVILKHEIDELVVLFWGITWFVENSVIFVQADLNSFSDAAEYATRFLAMLAGPLYPILQIVKERLVP